MKKLLATFIIAITLSTSAYAGNFKSYYDYASNLNSGLQISFSTSMINNYTRSNKMYKGMIDKYDHMFSKYSWFQKMKDRYAFQLSEINKFQQLINVKETQVTLVNTTYEVSTGVIVRRGETTLTNESTKVVEETSGNIVKEFAVVTKVYSTTIEKTIGKILILFLIIVMVLQVLLVVTKLQILQTKSKPILKLKENLSGSMH